MRLEKNQSCKNSVSIRPQSENVPINYAQGKDTTTVHASSGHDLIEAAVDQKKNEQENMPNLNQIPFIKITRALTILSILSFGCAKKTSPPMVDSKPQQSSSNTQPTASTAPKGIEVITLYTSHDDKIGDTKILISRPVGDLRIPRHSAV